MKTFKAYKIKDSEHKVFDEHGNLLKDFVIVQREDKGDLEVKA